MNSVLVDAGQAERPQRGQGLFLEKCGLHTLATLKSYIYTSQLMKGTLRYVLALLEKVESQVCSSFVGKHFILKSKKPEPAPVPDIVYRCDHERI